MVPRETGPIDRPAAWSRADEGLVGGGISCVLSLRNRRPLPVIDTLADRTTEPFLDPEPDDDLVANMAPQGDRQEESPTTVEEDHADHEGNCVPRKTVDLFSPRSRVLPW